MKTHKLSKEMNDYRAELSNLYKQGKVLEGDILEQENYGFNSSSLVLLVVSRGNLMNDGFDGIYSISQNNPEEIFLQEELAEYAPIGFFVPGQKKYENYKLMLQNSGIWEDNINKWSLRERLAEEARKKSSEEERLAFREKLKQVSRGSA